MIVNLITDEDFLSHAVKAVGDVNAAASLADSVQIEKLDGNMNRVRRMIFLTEHGATYAFIVKHVPVGGALSRFPSLSFPEDRLSYERLYHDRVLQWRSARNGSLPDIRTPRIYSLDEESRVLVMEDFGGRTLNEIRTAGRNFETLLAMLGSFFGRLHSETGGKEIIDNPSAKLNREFVFRFHVENPEKVQTLWRDQNAAERSFLKCAESREAIDERIREQEEYLEVHGDRIRSRLLAISKGFESEGPSALTHGDLHTGSLLIRGKESIGVIDAELCDTGAAAFDAGTLSAHVMALAFKQNDNIEKAKSSVSILLRNFTNQFQQSDRDVTLRQSAEFAGAELLRRIIGPAGFDATIRLDRHQRRILLDFATELITRPDSIAVWIKNL